MFRDKCRSDIVSIAYSLNCLIEERTTDLRTYSRLANLVDKMKYFHLALKNWRSIWAA